MTQPMLWLGSQGSAVVELARLLQAHGFALEESAADGFGPELEECVQDFQRTHLGPDGRFLEVDGVVGPKTWWALAHASGAAQRSYIEAAPPRGLTPLRRRLLEVALAEHARGVAELPDGSNRGPDVDRYLPGWLTERPGPGPAWCCFFYSWVVKSALHHWPLGQREGNCMQARARAGALGLWTPLGSRGERPLPGDAFVMNRGGGRGHIGFVLRVSQDGTQINTLEGNCGNRVKLGLRELRDSEISGFIDNVPSEAPLDFERGIVSAKPLGGASTR
jgi:hypothetical protein